MNQTDFEIHYLPPNNAGRVDGDSIRREKLRGSSLVYREREIGDKQDGLGRLASGSLTDWAGGTRSSWLSWFLCLRGFGSISAKIAMRDATDIIRCNFVDVLTHFRYGDFSVVDEDLAGEMPQIRIRS